MFHPRERRACAVCGVALVPLDKLPLSIDALHEDGTPPQPEFDLLPATYLGRGRGLLAVFALAGMTAFFLPWVNVTLPDIVSYSGFALARRLGWVWAAGVAWLVLVPTVVSRRSIGKMRGARVAAAFLAAIPGVTAALLLSRPPHGSHGVPLKFTFGFGLYAALALSVAAFAIALRFGGRADDIRVKRGTSQGQLVH
ncbi:MAG TPA: hypothetical protein VGY54_23805 [Polyangiaceae bacterium]|jgi:hypothetical protein|nr:hypothetical protein [Polyangiaceae bacterium]